MKRVQLKYIKAQDLATDIQIVYGQPWDVQKDLSLVKDMDDDMADLYIDTDRVFEIVKKEQKKILKSKETEKKIEKTNGN